jgi:hypothetical protein
VALLLVANQCVIMVDFQSPAQAMSISDTINSFLSC